MSSNVSTFPVTDGFRPGWPVGVQARAVWLRRLQWQPGARRTAGAGPHGGLRLATSQWLDALARRPGLHAKVVRRSMGIWSSCAMDWRALTLRQLNRAQRTGTTPAGTLAPGGRTLVHWHISERTIVQQGTIRYAEAPAQRIASRGVTDVVRAPLEQAGAARTTAMTYVVKVAGDEVTMPARSAPSGQGKVQETAVAQGLISNAVAITYAATPPGHEASAFSEKARPSQPSLDFFVLAQRKRVMQALQARAHAATPRSGQDKSAQHVVAPVPMTPAWPVSWADVETMRTDNAPPVAGHLTYDYAVRGLHDTSHGQTRSAMPTTVPPPLRFDLPRTRRNDATLLATEPLKHGEPIEWIDRGGQRHGSASDATPSGNASNTSEAPMLRDDIEHVAQRVMRIIAREQRREREAKGIN